MDTKVHIKLWHTEFWFMAVANLLLTMSVYCLLPVVPVWLTGLPRFTTTQVAVSMGAFGVGLFALGGFCSFLVQRFRRNRVFMAAAIAAAVCSFAVYYIEVERLTVSFAIFVALRLIHGAFYGLAKMVLASTLIIDTCESSQRTAANYGFTWFGRFALSLGPFAGLFFAQFFGVAWSLALSVACALTACALVRCVRFPFRAPEYSVAVFGLDRFLLTKSVPLFSNLALVAAVAGMVYALPLKAGFYGYLMFGFLLALLSKRFVFANADLKSEVVSGLLVTTLALLLLLFRAATTMAAQLLSPVLLGLGIGITASRFLLFFVRISDHCQRGTSQSTYILSWEMGFAAGLAAGLALASSPSRLLLVAVAVVAVSLALYNVQTHSWFLRHKKR